MKNIFIIFSFFTIVCSQNLISIVTQTHSNGELPSEIYYYQKSNNKLNLVKIERYYESGQQKSERDLKRGKLIAWYKNGQIKEKSSLRDGELNGLSITYYKNGQKESEGRYINNQKDGQWKYWGPKGKVIVLQDNLIGEWCVSYSWSCGDDIGFSKIILYKDGLGIGYDIDNEEECVVGRLEDGNPILWGAIDSSKTLDVGDCESTYFIDRGMKYFTYEEFGTTYYFKIDSSEYGSGPIVGGYSGKDTYDGFTTIYRIK